MTVRIAATLLVVCAVPLAGQVGSMPASSPYRDLEHRQEFGVFGGYFGASKDPVGVAPQAGPMLGALYTIRMGGPAWFYARVAGVMSERDVIDPNQPLVTRQLGRVSSPLLTGDVGLSINLTGHKSWRALVPVVYGGLGLTTALSNGSDAGGYQFGSPFTLAFGTGLKYVGGRRLVLRADVGSHLYKINYPQTYFVKTTGDPPVLDATQQKSVWRNNVGLTLGASYILGAR